MEPNVIPVWCIIDVVSVLSLGKGGTIDQPTNLGAFQESDAYVAMVVPTSFLDGANGISEISIKSVRGNSIEVFMTSYRPNDVRASLVAINPNRPEAGVLQPFQLNGNPALGTTEYMRASVMGEVGAYTGFDVVFSLSNLDGEILGYFYWDPKVTVIA